MEYVDGKARTWDRKRAFKDYEKLQSLNVVQPDTKEASVVDGDKCLLFIC